MAPPTDNSLEALSNLLYLIRRSLDDPAKVTKYLDFDQVVIDIAASRRHHLVHSPQGLNRYGSGSSHGRRKAAYRPVELRHHAGRDGDMPCPGLPLAASTVSGG